MSKGGVLHDAEKEQREDVEFVKDFTVEGS